MAPRASFSRGAEGTNSSGLNLSGSAAPRDVPAASRASAPNSVADASRKEMPELTVPATAELTTTSEASGRPVRNELFARWQKATHTAPTRAPQVARLRKNVPFDELDPSRQTAIVERYADVADFHIKPGNSELRMLELLCERLEHKGVHAAFFISPLDLAALRDFEVFDRQQYDANVALIRAVVEKHGLTMIDWNQPRRELPRTSFADLTHTTDAGSALLARRLYGALTPLLATAEEGS